MSNLLPVIKAIIFGRDKYNYGLDEKITMEPVEAVVGQGRAQVRGAIVPITGLATVEKGELVAVAWKKGMPVAIIKHRARRAQTHGKFYEGGGIVEQLFIANRDKLGNDVWYRNGEKVVKVRVGTIDDNNKLTTVSVRNHPGLQGQAPEEVKWGLDGMSFAVRCANGLYATFRFLGRGNPNKYDEKFPGEATFAGADRPLQDTTPLTTVSYVRRVTKSFMWWVAKCFVTWAYKAVQSAWYDGGYWVYYSYMSKLEQDWETSVQGQGTASASTAKSFPLKALLTTGVPDWYGTSIARGSVEDWYLDGERNLQFLIRVEWDYFWVGTNAVGTGTIHYPWGRGPGYMEGYSETITAGGGGVGCIGAKRQSDHQTVPEVHYFLYDAFKKTCTWATAADSPQVGTEQFQFSYGMWEHEKVTDPGYSGSALPNPHQPGWDRDPSNREGYYLGANWSNLPVTNHWKTEGTVGREGMVAYSSTRTFQLFDPTKLPCLTGPFTSENMGGYTWGISMLGLWTAWYNVSFKVRTGGLQVLNFYTMQKVQVFSRATAVGAGGGIYGLGNDEALLFCVVERYPFISGTGYINDLPMIWVGIIDTAGKAVHTLRDWQYGLAGAELLTGNGHEVVWMLLENAMNPKPKFFVTNLDSKQETAFSNEFANTVLTGDSYNAMKSNDIAWFQQSRAKLFTPNFFWSYRDPEKFYGPTTLPVMEENGALMPFAHLEGGEMNGSTRMINDAEILEPLGKYQVV